MSINYTRVQWYLVFSDTEAEHWWNRWLKPGFRHVFAIRRQGDIWLAFSPQQGFTDIDALEGTESVMDIITNPHATVLHCDAERVMQGLRVRSLFAPFTCVEQVKSLLGIRHWCFTPYQLYRQLMDIDKGIKGVIAEGVAEGMKTAHMNKTPEEAQEHPDIAGLSPRSLLSGLEREQ